MLSQNHQDAVDRFFILKNEVSNLAKTPKHMKLVDHNDVVLIAEYIEEMKKAGEDLIPMVTDFVSALNNIRYIAKFGGKREAVVAEVESVLSRHNFEIILEGNDVIAK